MKRRHEVKQWVLWTVGVVTSTAVLAGTPQTPSSTYFVAVTGNDAGRGTTADPWRTIQRCVDQAVPGSTCVIGPGSFTEAVNIAAGGSTEAAVRVTGQENGASVIEGSLAVSGQYVVVENLRVNMPAAATWGLRLAGHAGVARNIHVRPASPSLGTNNAAASISGSQNTLTRSRLEGTCFGLTLGGTSNVVSHNEITDLWLNSPRCGDVDYVRLFGSNHQLRNNVLHGIDRSRTGSAHVDCFQTFDNNGPDRAVQNIVIDGNFCSDVSQGVLFQARVYRQSRGILITNNVFSRVAAWCALLEDIDDVRMYNNTCDTTTAHHGMWCRATSNVGSCEFKNNIFYGRGTAYGVMGTARLIDGNTGAPGRNNLLFATEGPGAFKGYGADRLNVNPRFANPAAGDYRLLAESPARDAGVVITGWQNPTDYDGVSRPQGQGWDIGAFEYTDTPPTSPHGLRVLPAGPSLP